MTFLARACTRLNPRLLSRRKALCLSVLLVVGLLFAVSAFAITGPTSTPTASPAAHADTGGIASGGTMLDYGLAFLGLAFSALAWAIGKLIIIVIGAIIIPILGYNSFGSSNVVSTGWALVRDVVNMFVIVVLLLIAVQTMLGIGRIDWRQQLPRFFLAIVAVNFSKTITLFIIDIGQVVMFTFVNALTDIAAGNFINLLQISAFFENSENQASVEGIVNAGGYNAIGFLGTSWLTVSLLGMVLAVLLLMALVYIYRIVVLWVLIVVSPIAFFAGGVGNTLSSLGGQYADWWKRLVGAVALGPILTFFLWLALASASSGPIAVAENFNTTPSDDATVAASGPYTEIFEVDRFLSLLLALVLISVGFQAASSQAQALGGPAASLISDKTGQRLLKGAVAAPGALAYAGGRGAYRGSRAAGRYAAGKAEEKGYRFAPSKVADSIAQVAAPIASTGALGRVLTRPAFALQDKASSFKKETLDKSKKSVESYSDTRRFAEYDAIGQGQDPGLLNAGDRAVLQSKLATDKGEQKAYKSFLEGKGLSAEDVKDQFDSAMGISIAQTEKNKGDLLGDDKGLGDRLFKTKSANLHLMKDMSQSDVNDHIGDEDFKLSQLSADSAKDSRVIEALKSKEMSRFTDIKTGLPVVESAWDYVKRGRGGVSSDVREVATDMDKDLVRDFGAARPDEIAQRLGDGVMKVKDLTVQNLDANEGKAQESIVSGLRQASNAGVDLHGMDQSVKDRIVPSNVDYSTIADPQVREETRQMNFSITRDSKHLGINDNGSIAAGQRGTVNAAIRSNPQLIASIIPEIETTPEGVEIPLETPTATTNEAIRSVKGSDLTKMAEGFRKATDEQKKQIQASLDAVERAVKVEKTRAKAEGTSKQIKTLERSLSTARRQTE